MCGVADFKFHEAVECNTLMKWLLVMFQCTSWMKQFKYSQIMVMMTGFLRKILKYQQKRKRSFRRPLKWWKDSGLYCLHVSILGRMVLIRMKLWSILAIGNASRAWNTRYTWPYSHQHKLDSVSKPICSQHTALCGFHRVQ